MNNLLDSNILAGLSTGAEAADANYDWPLGWDLLRQSGVLTWSIPREYGGAGCPAVEVLPASESIAGACLTTAFIFSQREAAVRRLLAGPTHLKEKFLPPAATGQDFLTIGVSQITTSRQHLGPALRATPFGSAKFRLDGEIPWVTGADRAVAIVVGATLPDGNQVLLLLPTDSPGVIVDPPMNLAALRGSRTSSVRCASVELGNDWLIAGPAERVLGTAGGGGLETSALALGLAGAAIDLLTSECLARPELAPIVSRFAAVRAMARQRLVELVTATPDANATLAIRTECTRLALHASQAGLLAAKGTGFVAPHPAQRYARQALFFLVWSCPRAVAEEVLAGLTPAES
jgi:butyryl-CoA dehydrogenase